MENELEELFSKLSIKSQENTTNRNAQLKFLDKVKYHLENAPGNT